ncbi:hypothetical protein Pfo_020125 [Paulownia fortunei]|nr:hypothetical protein Pfo_020125 [Paulownia fortunei]
MGSSTYNDALQKELEDELVDVGNRLLMLPSSTDEILILLEKAESLLARVWQQSPRSTEVALLPVMKALITDELLRHADVNIQVAVASCTNEITRITAPIAPYTDDLMKEIFQLFMVALKQLSSESGSNYLRALHILEALATVRSCLIMMDIDIDAMIVEMFQLFFNIIRSNHSSDIIKYMETIMTLVIEESDEVSLELLRPLLASVRMDNKNISPISWELGKTVFEKCATKLQPCLREAVKPMNLEVDDYAEIVASLCQDTSNGKNMVAEEVVANVPFVAAGLSGDEVSKLDGISEAEQEDCTPQVKDGNGNILDDENSLETLKCCQQIVQLKSNDVKSDIEIVNNAEIVQSETDTVTHRRRRGRKPNSLIRPEEGYEHTWTRGGKDSSKLSCDSNNKEKKDLLLPLELGNANMPSDSSQREFDSVNEEIIGKRGQSKKKESMMNQHNDQELSSKLRRKILQSKGKERGSNTSKKTTKRVIAGSSTVSVEKGEGNHTGIDPEGKDELLLQELSGRKQIRDEIISQKHESKDVADKVVESPISRPAKAKYPGNLTSEKEEKSRRSHVDYGEEMVNLRIMVWWPMDKTFYTGTVEAFDPLTKKHRIKYDDDEEEVLNLREERWELFSDKQPRQIQSSQKQEVDHPSPAKEPIHRTQKKIAKRKAGSSKKHAASSSKRSKSEGRSLVKYGDSAPGFIHVNDEPDEDNGTCEANFSSKDGKSRAGKKVSKTLKNIREPSHDTFRNATKG